MRDLHDEELRALLAFRQRHGRCWKAALLLRWSAGTDADEPGSPHLRHLRNIGGPRWLIGLSAATLDDAARRFAGNVDPVLIDIFMENATGFARGASASVGIAPASAAHSLAIAIELSLKAYLMKAGYADDWNRVHIRHDLEKALALATEAGLSGLPLELPDLTDAEAESALRKAVEAVLESGACGPMREVAELLVHHGDDDDALGLLDQALTANEDCYCSLVLQGDIAARRHNEDGARKHFEAALALNDIGVSALTGLARISTPFDAQALIGRAMEADPDNPKCLLARAQLTNRELQSRIEDGSEALKRDPDLTEARLFLAPLEAKRGDIQAAIAHLSAALPELETRRELIPSFVDTSLELARVGFSAELSTLLESEEGRTVEPLSVALKLDRGETPAVAKEIREVALDILEQLHATKR